MNWIALFISSIAEVMWATSLKFLDFKKMKSSYIEAGFGSLDFLFSVIPLMTYVVFGIANVIFFSYACKSLPLAICYSVWMGLALALQTIIDVFYFKEQINKKQLMALGILMIGIIGLRLTFNTSSE